MNVALVGTYPQQVRHCGALHHQGQKGLGSHIEESEHAEAAAGYLVIQQHKQGQRQANCTTQTRPAKEVCISFMHAGMEA